MKPIEQFKKNQEAYEKIDQLLDLLYDLNETSIPISDETKGLITKLERYLFYECDKLQIDSKLLKTLKL